MAPVAHSGVPVIDLNFALLPWSTGLLWLPSAVDQVAGSSTLEPWVTVFSPYSGWYLLASSFWVELDCSTFTSFCVVSAALTVWPWSIPIKKKPIKTDAAPTENLRIEKRSLRGSIFLNLSLKLFLDNIFLSSLLVLTIVSICGVEGFVDVKITHILQKVLFL